MDIEVSNRASQALRQLDKRDTHEIRQIFARLDSWNLDEIMNRLDIKALSSSLKKTYYIRGPKDLRVVISINVPDRVLVEDIISKQMLQKISGKLIS